MKFFREEGLYFIHPTDESLIVSSNILKLGIISIPLDSNNLMSDTASNGINFQFFQRIHLLSSKECLRVCCLIPDKLCYIENRSLCVSSFPLLSSISLLKIPLLKHNNFSIYLSYFLFKVPKLFFFLS